MGGRIVTTNGCNGPTPRVSRRRAIAISLAALGGFCRQSLGLADTSEEKAVHYGHERRYEVTHTAEVTLGDFAIRPLEIWLPLPMSHPEQKVERLTVKPRVPIFADAGGQAKVAKRFVEDTSGRGKTVRLSASYEVLSRERTVALKSLARRHFGEYQKDREYEYYTRAEKLIETHLPAVVQEARHLMAAHSGPVEVARAAYDWVADRTQYKLVQGIKGAAYCLEHSFGECGEYAALFVALCRAAGIPARAATGFWGDGTDKWHCWAEFMLPTGEWLPVDACLGAQNRRNRARYFGGLDNGRVCLCKTYDISLVGNVPGRREWEFLQVGAWWWTTPESTGGRQLPEARFTVTAKPLSK